MRQKNSTWTTDELVNRLIQEKAIFLGAQGLATSLLPGFAVGLLAVDMAGSMAAQAELIFQIACAHGNRPRVERKNERFRVASRLRYRA